MIDNLTKPYVIFAPHIDDETIGCFRYIQNNLVDTVYFFYECTEVRKTEAISLSLVYGFNVVFDSIMPVIDKDKIILVPNCHDHHEHHRAINKLAKIHYTNQLKYYSVDMNVHKDILPDNIRHEKKIALNFYQSQFTLLSDEKYHLFESITDDDMESEYSLSLEEDGKTLTIKTDVGCIDYYLIYNIIKRNYPISLNEFFINTIIKELICIDKFSNCSYISVTISNNLDGLCRSITKKILL